MSRFKEINCKLCNRIFSGQITGMHLKSHNTNTEEYEIKYGSTRTDDFNQYIKEMGSKGGGNPNAMLAWKNIKKDNIENYLLNPKHCNHCYQILKYDKKENKFCSKKCYGQSNIKQAVINQDRKCVDCGKQIKSQFKLRCGKCKSIELINSKPKCYCQICNKQISSANKSKLCQVCYLQSDQAIKQRGKTFSKTRKTRINPYDSTEFYIMSSLEDLFFDLCIHYGIIFKKADKIIYYDSSKKSHMYFPDFYLPEIDTYIEIKGFLTKEDKLKMDLVINQNPNLKIKILYKNEFEHYIKSIKSIKSINTM